MKCDREIFLAVRGINILRKAKMKVQDSDITSGESKKVSWRCSADAVASTEHLMDISLTYLDHR